MDILELALSYWRMLNWVERVNVERKMAANSALRQMKQYLQNEGVELFDFVGQKYDAGLAVDVLGCETIHDVPEEDLIIIETVRPTILKNGNVMKYGQVILGEQVKQASAIKELPTDPQKAIPIVIEALEKYCRADYRDKKIARKMKWIQIKLTSQIMRIKKAGGNRE